MVTRFDEAQYWRTARGEVLLISEMETSHLMNTLRMFIRKPYFIASMLIADIEANAQNTVNSSVWMPDVVCQPNVKKDSIYNVTSMTDQQLTDYVFSTPLVCAMEQELNNRGVNVENMMQLWLHEDDVQLKGSC